MKTINVKVTDLSKHTTHGQIYVAKSANLDALTESIKESNGPRVPIIINEQNQIIDGVQRWLACKELGYKTIAAIILDKAHLGNSTALTMIAYNLHKRKTILEMMNEIVHLKKEWSKKQGERTDLNPEAIKESTRKRIAEHVGISEGNVHKLQKIYEVNKELLALIDTQEMSINEAYNSIPKTENVKAVSTAKKVVESSKGMKPVIEEIKCKCPKCGHVYIEN